MGLYFLFLFFVLTSLVYSGDVDVKDEVCRRKLMAISKNPILIGQTVPQCDKDGNYKARQCSGSTGRCWCVDKLTGKEVKYLDVDTNGLPLCDGDCRRKLQAISKNPILIGQTLPQCDKDGNYKARQCSGSTGSCWCVDKLTGKKIEYLDVDKNGLPMCDGDCRRKLKAISKNPILIGQTVPQCDRDGNYKARQCSGSTGTCWCVDKLTGKEIEYLHVDKNGLPLCEPNCVMELRKVPSILVQGVPVSVSADYVPECDKKTGYFLSKQCQTNKKQCWCVSKLGKEIENTRSAQNISCPT